MHPQEQQLQVLTIRTLVPENPTLQRWLCERLSQHNRMLSVLYS